ncbi:MAG: pyruvate formate lyase-activating protein [Clostridia bacterium]|nr:pyruvate formate lyase-activating protein [Clostridia bacterium]
MGKIHSIQSLGTVDGPGVRFVVFFQGCNLRCGCCHNPDTWSLSEGSEITAAEIVERAKRCCEYFGREGGITLSGGEPLLQADFAREIFELCHKEGINTCLDTSGSILNDGVLGLLEHTDRVLLDVKYTNDADYRKYVGCSLDSVLDFLAVLDQKAIATTVRQVIIPTLNDSTESVAKLKRIADTHKCVDRVELLPFKKICGVKYDKMGLEFPFAHLPTPTKAQMDGLNNFLQT